MLNIKCNTSRTLKRDVQQTSEITVGFKNEI